MPTESEFAVGNRSAGSRGAAERAFAEVGDGAGGKAASRVRSVKACVSKEEKKKRFGVALLNLLVWAVLVLLAIGTMGIIVIFYVLGLSIRWLLSEYNVRKLQALGTSANAEQFPEIAQALHDVCSQYGVKEIPKVIVLNVSETNAFAVKFARKKVIVLLSQTLEGILNRPAELRFILAHELAHIVLDHGARECSRSSSRPHTRPPASSPVTIAAAPRPATSKPPRVRSNGLASATSFTAA